MSRDPQVLSHYFSKETNNHESEINPGIGFNILAPKSVPVNIGAKQPNNLVIIATVRKLIRY